MEVARTHRWTRREVERMAEAGIFEPEARLELVDGELIEMSPQSTYHAVAVQLLHDQLRAAFADEGFTVRVQLPFALAEDDLPEPDLAVVPGQPRDYIEAHPTAAVLLAEVADTTLDYDRTRKLLRYARAGVPEYWILNVQGKALEIYRDPAGGAYQSKTTHRAGESVTPSAQPSAAIAVADLLP